MDAALEAKINACGEAVMILVAMLHEAGAVEGLKVSEAWAQRAQQIGHTQGNTSQQLFALASTLQATAGRWPAPGTPRPW